MTFFLFFVGVSLVAATVRLAIHAAVLPRIRLSLHLRSIQGYGFESDTAKVGMDPLLRLKAAVSEFAERMGRLTSARLPMLEPLRRGQLAAAGLYDVSPEAVHGYRAIAATVLPGFILFLIAVGGSVSFMKLLLVIGFAFAGWQLPAIVIRKRGEARLAELDRDLPDLIDLLTATIEAGMGIGGSIGLLAPRFKGALGQELRLALQQQTLGMTMAEALEDMVERCDTTSVRAFVRTVSRGESMGVSIGPILRELAVDTRRRRRQAAKEKMQKAPVKMLFPLMFLIFPALMIELLIPAGFQLMRSLGGG